MKCPIYAFLFVVVLLAACSAPVKKEYPTQSIESYYDIGLTDVERDSMQAGLENAKESYQKLHELKLENSVPMSMYFDPLPQGFQIEDKQERIQWNLEDKISLPANMNDLAFYPVHKLASLIKSRKITSSQLTLLYLERIRKYSDTLHCLITLTEQTAMEQARKADEEIASGNYRGPLHGIPYGIKDLLAVEGTKTTWGAEPYKEQQIDVTATVIRKLNEAGAVMLCKLTLGALAMGDIWYGGRTRNPWNLESGSSGSSAGPASATAAGLIAFAIGSETRGSIVSPSHRCGVTGLRPTFGAVSRYGAMTLSWSMDKIGPICRSALDCALVFEVIRGEDEMDRPTVNAAFNYDANDDVKKLRVGYLKTKFDDDSTNMEHHNRSLEVLRSLGIEPEPVELPDHLPDDAMGIVLTAEAAAAFDELTRSNKDDMLVNQLIWAWPNTFRKARFIPAVEYINAMRGRTLLIEAYHQATKDFDVIVTPTFRGSQLGMTNLTGHPCLLIPDGFNKEGSPTSITFLGKLYGEAALITLGRAFQDATEWDEQHPPLFIE
jgi:Asp-tRNA(Asn)/Glu-tRNA(Gln) amidotransferase A subunit family amidase